MQCTRLNYYNLIYCLISASISRISFCDAHSDFFQQLLFARTIRGGSTFPNDFEMDNFYAQFLSRDLLKQEEDCYPLSTRSGRAKPKSNRRSISSLGQNKEDQSLMADLDIRAVREASSFDPFSIHMEGYDDFSSEDFESSDNDNDNNNNNYYQRNQPMDNFDTLRQNSENSNSPVVYQYYGRSRARGNPVDPVHFILLGPNVDHWKVIGQLLASRGFNAMACERLDKESDRSPNLVLDILQVMKWKKVVLVGCDKEAILAMETAIMLSGDNNQVAGLVLCGDLSEADAQSSASGFDVLDSFLKQTLQCPFVIIWDGDSPSLIYGSTAHESVESSESSTDRCLILGGGSAPHRTKPEQFTWILTRFVEEKVEFMSQRIPRLRRESLRIRRESASKTMRLLQALNVPFGINSLVSPEGRLLLGRAAAAALFYVTMMKVAVVQYGILRAGLITTKSRFDSVATFRAKMFQAIGAFFLNYGYIPRLFKIRNEDAAKRKIDTSEAVESTETEKETKKKKKRRWRKKKAKMVEDELDELEEETEEEDAVIQEPDEIQGPKQKPFFFLDQIIA